MRPMRPKTGKLEKLYFGKLDQGLFTNPQKMSHYTSENETIDKKRLSLN